MIENHFAEINNRIDTLRQALKINMPSKATPSTNKSPINSRAESINTPPLTKFSTSKRSVTNTPSRANTPSKKTSISKFSAEINVKLKRACSRQNIDFNGLVEHESKIVNIIEKTEMLDKNIGDRIDLKNKLLGELESSVENINFHLAKMKEKLVDQQKNVLLYPHVVRNFDNAISNRVYLDRFQQDLNNTKEKINLLEKETDEIKTQDEALKSFVVKTTPLRKKVKNENTALIFENKKIKQNVAQITLKIKALKDKYHHNIIILQFKDFSHFLKLVPENIQDPKQSLQSTKSDQSQLVPASNFNFLFLKKFEEITKDNLEESDGEVENTEQSETNKNQDETTERISTLSQQSKVIRTVSDVTTLEDQSFENFNCALKDKILIQGKLYLTQDNLIFSSWFNVKTVFGTTKIIIPIDEILSIRKSKYLKIFNNGITLNTNKLKKITFVFFINRDKCFDLIEELINKKNNLTEEKLTEEKEEQEYFYDAGKEGAIVERVNQSDNIKAKMKENLDLPRDVNDIYYKRTMMKKIIFDTDMINKLETITRIHKLIFHNKYLINS